MSAQKPKGKEGMKAEKRSMLQALFVLIILISSTLMTVSLASEPSVTIDSDHDGMPDGWELRYGLNPDDPSDAYLDYNDNGLPNVVEYLLGYDPLSKDTDGDGISNRAEITGMFGFVTNPNPLYENTEYGFGKDSDGDGLTDLEEIVWYIDLHNNTQLREIFPYEKDLSVVVQKIKDLRSKYPWRLNPLDPDVDKDRLNDSAEISNKTSPIDPDTDHDGILDGDEILVYGTSPRDWDTDGDWLSDYEEITPGLDGFITDPNNADTDGDGVNDGEEVFALGAAAIPPSEHAMTYEQFVSSDAYAYEYVTLRAKIKKINPRPTHGNLNEYRIELEDPDGQTATSKTNASSTVRKAMLYVGNRWHYDYQHGGIFVDDVFGLALKEGDIIIVVGMARRHDDFEPTYRYITVKTGYEDPYTKISDDEGKIYLVLDPKEAYERWMPSREYLKVRAEVSPVIDGGGQATPPSRTMLTPTPRQHDAAAAYAEATTPAEPEKPEAGEGPTAAVENATVKGGSEEEKKEGRKTPPGFFTSIAIATLLIIYGVSKKRKNNRKKKNKKNAKKKA